MLFESLSQGDYYNDGNANHISPYCRVNKKQHTGKQYYPLPYGQSAEHISYRSSREAGNPDERAEQPGYHSRNGYALKQQRRVEDKHKWNEESSN